MLMDRYFLESRLLFLYWWFFHVDWIFLWESRTTVMSRHCLLFWDHFWGLWIDLSRIAGRSDRKLWWKYAVTSLRISQISFEPSFDKFLQLFLRFLLHHIFINFFKHRQRMLILILLLFDRTRLPTFFVFRFDVQSIGYIFPIKLRTSTRQRLKTIPWFDVGMFSNFLGCLHHWGPSGCVYRLKTDFRVEDPLQKISLVNTVFKSLVISHY